MRTPAGGICLIILAQGNKPYCCCLMQWLKQFAAYLWLCKGNHQFCHHQYIAAQGRGKH